jgi:hypothetical protein
MVLAAAAGRFTGAPTLAGARGAVTFAFAAGTAVAVEPAAMRLVPAVALLAGFFILSLRNN